MVGQSSNFLEINNVRLNHMNRQKRPGLIFEKAVEIEICSKNLSSDDFRSHFDF
jgi:hypothetical protein